MQHSPEDIKRRLLACIDGEYNVRDTSTCLAILGELEQIQITRKILEETRLGKIVNDVRRKSQNVELSKGLKGLVKKWREVCQPDLANDRSAKPPAHSQNGRQSPAISVGSLGRIKRGASPCLSSGNTSPSVIHSAPTTPSTLSQHTRALSPVVTTSRGSTPSRTKNAFVDGVDSVENYAPYTATVDGVPKTVASNKRLRKSDSTEDLRPSKRSKRSALNGFDDECSRDSVISAVSNDRVSLTSPEVAVAVVDTPSDPAIKKSRRRKTQDGVAPPKTLDALKQQMAVIGKKVKTTPQLVAELAEKQGDKKLAQKATFLEKTNSASRSRHDYRKGKLAHLQNFLSNSNHEGPVIDEIDLVDDDDDVRCSSRSSDPSIEFIGIKTKEEEDNSLPGRPNTPISNMDLLGIQEMDSPEEILSRLPPLTLDSLTLSSPASETMTAAHDVQPDLDILKDLADAVDSKKIEVLHNTNIDCINGNFDMDGRFREWHEVSNRRSYQESPLVVLPYIVLDY